MAPKKAPKGGHKDDEVGADVNASSSSGVITDKMLDDTTKKADENKNKDPSSEVGADVNASSSSGVITDKMLNDATKKADENKGPSDEVGADVNASSSSGVITDKMLNDATKKADENKGPSDEVGADVNASSSSGVITDKMLDDATKKADEKKNKFFAVKYLIDSKFKPSDDFIADMEGKDVQFLKTKKSSLQDQIFDLSKELHFIEKKLGDSYKTKLTGAFLTLNVFYKKVSKPVSIKDDKTVLQLKKECMRLFPEISGEDDKKIKLISSDMSVPYHNVKVGNRYKDGDIIYLN